MLASGCANVRVGDQGMLFKRYQLRSRMHKIAYVNIMWSGTPSFSAQ